MFEGLELEERIGLLWHRLVGDKASWPRHPEAAVALDTVRSQLGVFFRGLGGDRGVAIAAASARGSAHRLSWKQRVGMEDERLVVATRDEVSLALPDSIDLLPDPALNRDLYFWLAAFFAVLEAPAARESDPLRADLALLAAAVRATRTVLAEFPGLKPRHARLAAALRLARPERGLTGIEAAVERVVDVLLGGPPLSPFEAFGAVIDGRVPETPAAPRGYRPFLPVPLWGEALHRPPETRSVDDEDQDEDGGGAKEGRDKRRRSERKRQDQAERNDPLILNRFEKILAIADMVNVNRGIDDPDEEEAKKAADDVDKVVLSKNDRKAATKLKFDLDLPPEATDASRLTGTHLYPEWDYRIAGYHKECCKVLVGPAPAEGESWVPNAAAKRKIRQVKRQFEALRTKAMILKGQADGNELDTEAVVRARCDLKASGIGSDRVYLQRRPMERDLAVALLVDCSLSTDAWIQNRRVLDVEKEALAVFAHGLAACDDSFAVLTFTSRKRSWVKIDTVKDFDEDFGPAIVKRIGALKPGYYTRIGTAVRHTTRMLEARPNRHRLMLVLTDGKPNDIDHYEGRYGLEDTRKAIQEARAKGIVVFGVTIDAKAQSYFPHLFGKGGFHIVHQLAHLSAALPRLYRHLVQ
ncbi:MAG: VWA domain-containing protein [Magnetospirillum sp.]|nr:VWA domain-containing protein [Magnetospirillum sp.]